MRVNKLMELDADVLNADRIPQRIPIEKMRWMDATSVKLILTRYTKFAVIGASR